VFRGRAAAERHAKFETFRSGFGKPLQNYSSFEYLRERFSAPWQGWTQKWQRVTDALTHIKEDDIAFHAFVQWIADEQLGACRDLALHLGLPIGLYLDVAVGVDAGGADAWAAPDSISPQLAIGAPPDIYNPAGQNWGLAALRPQALIDADFELYRQTLRSAMKYAGAIRIDHALGLNRLFYIPAGAKAQHGGYVSFPFDAMLAVTAQESATTRCLVIGEDLGTIPEGVCDTLNSWGVWSYRVAIFERDSEHTFRWPDLYPQKAIVTFNTHDLPTFAGWATAHDLKIKMDIGLDPGETPSEREGAHNALRNTLSQQGLPSELSFLSMLRYLARTRCQILSVEIEDILGLQDQPNIPGTIDEYPNWRRRLPVSLDELADHETLHRIATVLAQEGRGLAKTN
jgi:4-alpha-glucanotransferase